MRRFVAVCVRYGFAEAKIPLSLGYPFEYSLMADGFALHDIRFTELPLNRQLAQPQKEHIHLVLGHFQKMISGDKVLSNQLDRDFILGSLGSKAKEIRQILIQSCIDVKFKFNLDTVIGSKGYLQIKPEPNVSLKEKDLHEIHQYWFQRDKEVLKVGLRLRKQELSQEEMLKKDIQWTRAQSGSQIRERLESLTKKQKTFADRMMERLMRMGKAPKKNTQFEPYYVIQQIGGTMSCAMTHQSKVYEDQDVSFDSKWLYFVRNLESEDLRKHRKRVLFDFQFWNRGNFFPLHDFAADISALE